MRRGAARAALAVLLVVGAGLFGAMPASAEDGTKRGRVYPDAESVEPLPVGARVPSVEVRTIDGAPVDLATLVAERGALLVFYRGGW